MINIERPTETPASLQSLKIRDYLDLLAKYQENPTEISKPEKPAEYRSSDILTAFDLYFFSKCYLTEQSFGSAWEMDIEHFIPFNERPDLVCEWTNLYPAAHKANMLKPNRTPEGGYLDPCDANDDVENEITYALVEYGKSPRFQAMEATNRKAANTATLLNLLHNGREQDENSRNNTKHLRTLIKIRYDEIMEAIIKWQGATEGVQKFSTAEELKALLSRRASFTMLMRSMDAVQVYVPKDFLD